MEQEKIENSIELENGATSVATIKPAKIEGKVFCHHLGIILSNLGIFTCVAGIVVFFSFLITPLYACLLILLTLATLGTIFLMIPNFSEWWALLPKLSEKIGSTIPASLWLLGLSMGLSTISLILIATDKERRTTARIVGCAVTFAISLIGFLIFYFNLARV